MARLNTDSLRILNAKPISSSRLTFIVLGDSHLRTTGYNAAQGRYILDTAGERYRRILRHIVTNYRNVASFVLHGGDAIGEGNKENNFKAFVSVSSGILFPANLPIFVTIGNHDFAREGGVITPRLFEQYIGNIRSDIRIHGANVHLIQLPTFFNGLTGPPYFRPADLTWLRQRTQASSRILVDFHADLRVGQNRSFPENNHYVLSTTQTNAFFNVIRPSVKAIFNHHRHTSYRYTIQRNLGGMTATIPYLITGCGGNVTSSPACPNYYVVTYDRLNTSNPTFSFVPVRVPGL
ncbi:metallophosphoesterase family protein [Fictibacillus fluitans]|uniref:Metallophosphoesterase n=1 Tax=Fictibacillus fluitans TaxID=3058422 RepID=A0ABT8HWA3_9BACL|nr:metallophosphoesterase [Fictibacillus sp. NE201]MDN4525056.1 metallophosphoesterase [Fictibacillus sp. NE201]